MNDAGQRANDAGANATGPSAVWSALGVRGDEVATVRRLFQVSLVLGMALVLFYGGSNALFLTQYDIDVLPWVYVVNAAMVVVVGLLYSAASRRLDVQQLLVRSATMIAASVLGLWVWAMISDASIVSFMMAAWFRLLFIFAFLGLWEIASTLFDIRQAKRLFPAVALGSMLAFVVGGALTGPITAVIGTRHLVLASAICFGAYVLGLRSVLRRDMNSVAPDMTPPAGPRAIVSDSYSRLLAAMRSTTILLTFVGEFIFYEQSAATFETEESLAAFLGVFIAVSTLVMVMVTAAIAGRYIAHFGVKVGLVTMPAGIGITVMAAALWGTFVGVDTVFFVLVVASMVANLVLGNAIEVPVGALMFQPLPTDRRMPVRVAIDGWLGSVALFGTGFLLLAFGAADFDTVVPFAWLLGLIGLAGVWVAIRLHQGYTDALRAATTRAFAGEGDLPTIAEDRSLDVVAAGGPTSVLAGGALLALGPSSAGADPVLDTMLGHPDAAIVEVAVDSLVSGDSALVPGPRRVEQLAAIVEKPTIPAAVRVAALGVLARADRARAVKLANKSRTDAIELEHAALALGLQTQRDDGPARKKVGSLVRSDAVQDRVHAAQILQLIDQDVPAELVTPLLTDRDDRVRLAAVVAVDGKVSPRLAPLVLEAGTSASIRRAAVGALASSPAGFITEIEHHSADLSIEYRAELIAAVYPQQTRSPSIIHPYVAPGLPSQIRHAGFRAIQQTGIAPPASPERMIRDDLAFARYLVASHRDVAEQAPALGWALASEFDRARSSVYQALAIDHVASRIHDIEAIAARGVDDDRANAIEALDVMLSGDVRRTILPVLEPRTIDDARDELVNLANPVEPADRIAELVADLRLGPWTKKTAAHAHAPTTDREPAMSEIIERIVALKAVDIFSTLPYPLLAELAQGVAESSFEADQLIIANGALDQELYALTSGTVRVEVPGSEPVVLEAGTVFGELAVLSPAPRSADVIAANSCTVLVVRRDVLLALVDRHPEVMVEIAGVLAARLRS